MVVQGNVLLSTEPPCVDFLLLRRQGGTGVAAALTDGPRILRRLWPTLPRATLMEYRSPLNPYRRGDLDRLWGYLHIYFANQHAKSGEGAGAPGKRAVAPSDPPDVCARGDVAAVLVVARRPAALDEDVAAMGLSWEGFGPGYWRVRGGLFALYVVPSSGLQACRRRRASPGLVAMNRRSRCRSRCFPSCRKSTCARSARRCRPSSGGVWSKRGRRGAPTLCSEGVPSSPRRVPEAPEEGATSPRRVLEAPEGCLTFPGGVLEASEDAVTFPRRVPEAPEGGVIARGAVVEPPEEEPPAIMPGRV